MRKTKIIATIGPATSSLKIIKKLKAKGMDVARINASHASIDEFKARAKLLKRNNIPVMLDTQGPEIRLLCDIDLSVKKGQLIELSKSVRFNKKVNLKLKSKILVNEGNLILSVLKLKPKTILRANNTGIIKNRARVNIQSLKLNSQILSSHDRKLIRLGLADFIALSYTKNAEDIIKLRKLTDACIIAKIENLQGLNNFDKILDKADGIMIARGDLGVEVEPEKLPLIQKNLIQRCNQAGKSVITATQMLESMIDNPRPTRAETSDVANAILDGTDAIMLSGETAIGKYPVAAVNEMRIISLEVENKVKNKVSVENCIGVSQAISVSIFEMTKVLPISKIISLTRSGYTARIISRFRHKIPVIAVTPSNSVKKTLDLYYGVKSVVIPQLPTRERIRISIKYLLKHKIIAKNDLLLITAGLYAKKSGSTNLIEVHRAIDLVKQ